MAFRRRLHHPRCLTGCETCTGRRARVLVADSDQFALARTDAQNMSRRRKTTQSGSAIACAATNASPDDLLRRINCDGGVYRTRTDYIRKSIATFDRVRIIGRDAHWASFPPPQLQGIQSASSTLSRIGSVSKSIALLSFGRSTRHYTTMASIFLRMGCALYCKLLTFRHRLVSSLLAIVGQCLSVVRARFFRL